MKKVLLLGDSIRMGYDEYVRMLLKDEYEVYYDEDNGRFALYTLWQANQMIRRYGNFDIVHWNNGYWDMNTEPPMDEPIHSVEEYTATLERIIHLLRSTGAKIIFATTTPVPDTGISLDNTGTQAQLCYNNDLVKRYNAAAAALMQRENIPIDDLYALCEKDPHYYKGRDRLHLTEEGYQVIAAQAADMIRKVAQQKIN